MASAMLHEKCCNTVLQIGAPVIYVVANPVRGLLDRKKSYLRAVLMGTKSCTKILILPKIFPTRFRFTFYG